MNLLDIIGVVGIAPEDWRRARYSAQFCSTLEKSATTNCYKLIRNKKLTTKGEVFEWLKEPVSKYSIESVFFRNYR